MKPFDLEKAKAGAKICTRSGFKVEILRFDIKNSNYPIVALVTNNDGTEHCYMYTKDGKYNIDLNKYPIDLVIVPVKHRGWINIYPSNNKCNIGYETGSNIFPSKEMAILAASSNHIATIPIEWEE